jgi:shikimate kinase
MATGKTKLGPRLARSFGVPFFDLDAEIEREANQSIATIFRNEGEASFRLLESQVLKKINEINPAFVMSTGGGTPCFFDQMHWLNQQGLTLWIDLPVAAIVNRLLESNADRPLVKGKTEHELTEFVSEHLSMRLPFYRESDIQINGHHVHIDEVVEKIRSHEKYAAPRP